jgi:hypothetical protein
MNTLAPLVAALNGDLMRLLVIITIIALSGLARLLARLKQAQQPRPPVGVPRQPKPPAGDPVADEIDEFLRRVAQRGNRKGVEPAAARPTLPELPVTPKGSSEKPIVAETAVDTPVGGQVTEHVTQYLDEGEFARRSEQLGAEVFEADREADQHLHQTFDHSVSKLANVPGEAAAPPTTELADSGEFVPDVSLTAPTDLFLALADPDSIRQAIVLSEILHRPEERWL